MAPLNVGGWRVFVLVAVLASVFMTCARIEAAAMPTDMAVKAAFLPRFARYVTWPPTAMPKGSDPFTLCVIGTDPFGPMLDDAARSQLIDGRRIVVRRIESVAAADSCQIAFIHGSRLLPANELIATLGKKPVLTVTDAANGPQRGIVHFAVVSGRVRFFIDQAAATQHGLSISSRLLALALGVKQ